jgi:hypothetical protein
MIDRAYDSSIIYRGMDTYTFTLLGGEQSAFDHAALLNADKQIEGKILTGYLLDEDDPLMIMASRSTDGSYSFNYTSM